MREILFRGIDEVTNDWVYGHYFEKPSEFGGETRYYIFDSKTITRYSVIPETVGQYTGLTANGTKIFEGDIVRYEYQEEYGEIVYDEETAMFMVTFDSWCVDFDHYDAAKLEVVGRIHDKKLEDFENGC